MEKKHKVMNWTALLTALLSFSGGLTKSYFDAETEDDIKNAVAAEVATLRAFEATTAKALEDSARAIQSQQEQIMGLREAMAGVKASLELLNDRALLRGRHEGYGRELNKKTKEVEEALEKLERPPAPPPEPMQMPMRKAPAMEEVQQMRKEIFK